MFGFQQLDVYRCAIQFLGLAAPLSTKPPRGYAALRDQLRRASLSISLNIAEGSGAAGPNEAKRYYAIARGSALECAGIMEAMRVLRFVGQEEITTPMGLLDRIVAMLTVMLR
jgi:four helix bundle protein